MQYTVITFTFIFLELQALCILSLNIVIDKVYLVLWYWYFLVTLLGTIRVLCRIVQIASPHMRFWLMKMKMHRYIVILREYNQIQVFLEFQRNSVSKSYSYVTIIIISDTLRTRRIRLGSSLTFITARSGIGLFCIK